MNNPAQTLETVEIVVSAVLQLIYLLYIDTALFGMSCLEK